MKKFPKILLFLILAVFLVDGSAWALPFNSRPVPGLTNLSGLQTFFDNNGQAINVYNDQNGAAIWTTAISGNSQFTIMLEQASWAGTNKFGLYNYGDTSTLFQIFDGGSSVNWHAVAGFNSGGTPGKTVVTLLDDDNLVMGQTIHYGVNSNAFGFYLDASGSGYSNAGLYFSEDDQNPLDTAQNLVYAGIGNNFGNWWICFEDQARWLGSDSDFTDFVVTAESVNPNPVPEPATMLLLGAGLIGLAGLGRKKLLKR